MYRQIPISEARQILNTMPEALAKEPGTIAVTKRGKPVLAVLPWDLYESLVETMEVLGDPELMSAVRHGIKEIRTQKTIPWESVKKELKL
jgi:antitoxin YefM